MHKKLYNYLKNNKIGTVKFVFNCDIILILTKHKIVINRCKNFMIIISTVSY